MSPTVIIIAMPTTNPPSNAHKYSLKAPPATAFLVGWLASYDSQTNMHPPRNPKSATYSLCTLRFLGVIKTRVSYSFKQIQSPNLSLLAEYESKKAKNGHVRKSTYRCAPRHIVTRTHTYTHKQTNKQTNKQTPPLPPIPKRAIEPGHTPHQLKTARNHYHQTDSKPIHRSIDNTSTIPYHTIPYPVRIRRNETGKSKPGRRKKKTLVAMLIHTPDRDTHRERERERERERKSAMYVRPFYDY